MVIETLNWTASEAFVRRGYQASAFDDLSRSGAFEAMMRVLATLDRARAGRDQLPTAAVRDAQAARSGTVGVAGRRGYDPAWRVVGRKRHALVDTDGRLLAACVSLESLHSSHGGIGLLRASCEHWPFLQRCFADSAYAGEHMAGATAIAVTVVRAEPGQRDFAIQPRRWVAERSFAARLGLAQGQVEHEPQGQHEFDGQFVTR